MAVGFAAAAGVLFGFYPVRKASRLQPIEVRRCEWANPPVELSGEAAGMESGSDSVALSGQPLDRLLAELGGTADGLSDADARARLARLGANDLSVARRRALRLQFLDRLHNPLLVILRLASGFSAAAGDLDSFAIVVAIVLGSVGLDFVQELRANTTIGNLRRSVALRARVLRDGRDRDLPVRELVPGDLLPLAAERPARSAHPDRDARAR